MEHLSELDRHEDDDNILDQGSHFKDRVFLSAKKERTIVRKLLTEDIEIDQFITSNILQSDNSRLLVSLVDRVSETWPDQIPEPYKRFIGNVCKPTSVSSYLRVTSDLPLVVLQSFCEETINVRSAANQNDLVLITKELPALWPNILEIVNLEKSEYLPQDMSRIILKMIQIRRNTFRNSAERLDEDYIHWESPEEEHPTAFYPQWPIF